MSYIQAFLLGIVQGITEFFPVSSSGHLVILENLFGMKIQPSVFFHVILHAGTLVAVILAFNSDVKRLILEFLRLVYDIYYNIRTGIHNGWKQSGRRYRKLVPNNYRKFMLLLIVSSVPTFIIGMLLEESVRVASVNLLAPGIGLLITGVLLFIADFFPTGNKVPKEVSYLVAVIIGVFQGFAVLPGISRAGVTIVACLLCGLNRKFAIRYSFLLSIQAVIGAVVLEIVKLNPSEFSAGMAGMSVLGFIAAAVTGCFCIKMMLKIVKRKPFRRFSVYCFFMAVLAIICNFAL